MRSLKEFFPELDPTYHEEAAQLGLEPVGWGKYVDPKKPTKVVARVVNGQLEAMPAPGGGAKTQNLGTLKQILSRQVGKGMNSKVADTLMARAEDSIVSGEQSEPDAVLNALRAAKAEMDLNG